MRNVQQSHPDYRLSHRLAGRLRLPAVMALVIFFTGCADQPQKTTQTLDAGYAALQAHRFDEAMTAADQVLTATPNGPGAAEARYLRGRVLEDRAMLNPSQLAAGLQQARAEYTTALDATPLPAAVEGNIRAGIANVAYHQDDYSTALTQWTASLDKLAKEQDKVQALYQMGKAAQRLGRWDEADKYYALVQEMTSGQPLAEAAKIRQGSKMFFVQIATVNTGKDATTLRQQLKTQGVNNTVALPDSTNPALTVIRVGPFRSFAEARAARTKFIAPYPNAIIFP